MEIHRTATVSLATWDHTMPPNTSEHTPP